MDGNKYIVVPHVSQPSQMNEEDCGLGMFPDLRDNSNDFSVVNPLPIVTSG